jgi:hypothetical protein
MVWQVFVLNCSFFYVEVVQESIQFKNLSYYKKLQDMIYIIIQHIFLNESHIALKFINTNITLYLTFIK